MEKLCGVIGVRVVEDVLVSDPDLGAEVEAGVRRRLIDVPGVVEHKVGVDACKVILEISAGAG